MAQISHFNMALTISLNFNVGFKLEYLIQDFSVDHKNLDIQETSLAFLLRLFLVYIYPVIVPIVQRIALI